MHDPKIVAFEIKSPFWRKGRWKTEQRHFPTLFTIWHVDPETDGTDDSCGWCYPKATKSEVEIIEAWASEEWKYYFDSSYSNLQEASVSEVLAAIFPYVRFIATGKKQHELLAPSDLTLIASLASNPVDNLRSTVASAKTDKYEFADLAFCLLRCYRRAHRPLWRHPRWHIHHWSVQWHFGQRFNRWAFSKCASCGGRFKWGESPCVGNWDHEGPRFLKGEKGAYHMACYNKVAYKPSPQKEEIPQ